MKLPKADLTTVLFYRPLPPDLSLMFLPPNIMELIWLTMVIVSVSSDNNEPLDVSWWRNPYSMQNGKKINNGYSIPNSNAITIKPNVQGKPTGFEGSSITRSPIISTKPGNFFNPSTNGKPIAYEVTNGIRRPIAFEESSISTNPDYFFNPTTNRKPIAYEVTNGIKRPIAYVESSISTNPEDFFNPSTNGKPIAYEVTNGIRRPIAFEGSSNTRRPIISTKPGNFFNPSFSSKPFDFEKTSTRNPIDFTPGRPIISTNPDYSFNPSTNRNPISLGVTSISGRPALYVKPNSFFNPSQFSQPTSLPSTLINPSFPSVPSSSDKWNQNAADSSNCNCGKRNSGRIVGGMETRRNEYPWMVFLLCGEHACGGSVITPYHVLTAAHCTYGIEPYQVTISVAKHNIENPLEGDHYSITRIIQHKEYSDDSVENDIALLVTRSPITFNKNVGPVCIPYKRFNMEEKEIKVTGWGRTEGTGDRNILHEGDLAFVPLEKCRQLRYTNVIMNTHLCAYKNTTDICTGDSGGPMVFLNPDNSRYYQVAVVSQGEQLCKSQLPSVNTDVFAYLNWINAAISESKPEVRACTAESNGY